MKQFSDIGQQTNQICDPWENGNKQGKPYDCPDFMPWGITQTVEKEVESWVEFWGPAELRWGDRNAIFSQRLEKLEFAGREHPKSAQGYPRVFAENRDMHVENESPWSRQRPNSEPWADQFPELTQACDSFDSSQSYHWWLSNHLGYSIKTISPSLWKATPKNILRE